MNQESPVVSVIIPVFNIEAYLPQCLESLTAQSFRNFEILCVDDASSDNSANVVRVYQKQDSRIRLLQQEHAGVSAARNLGIRQARGTYFLFFDGDDWAEPDMLASLVSAAESDRADIAVCSAYVECDCEDQIRRRLESLKKSLTVCGMLWEAGEDTCDVWTVLELPGSWPFVWNKLIRGDLVREQNILFSEKLQLGEDGLFLQILFQYARKVRFIQPALYHYRYQRKASATVRLFQEQQIRFSQHVEILRNLCGELDTRNKLEQNREDLLRWAVEFLYQDFLALPAQQQPEASRSILEVLGGVQPMRQESLRDRMLRKRLQKLCHTVQAPSKIGRMYRILQVKIENRILRLLSWKE